MDRTVARLNIKHYRRLLAFETDEGRRQILGAAIGRGRSQINRPQATRKSTPATLVFVCP